MERRTLPREPYRGGQIYGNQLDHTTWTSRALYCGEPKKGNEVLCDGCWIEYLNQEEAIPRFAEGNTYGHYVQKSVLDGRWRVYDSKNEVLIAECDTEAEARTAAGQDILQWEGENGEPIDATPEEIMTWRLSSA